MHPAVIAGNVTLSYADLAMRASSVAVRLMEDGVKRGDRIGLLGNNAPEWLEIFFGAAALGAVVAPFSTWSTAAELEFLLQDAKVSTLFTMRGFGDHNFAESIQALRTGGTVPALKRVIVYDGQRGMGDTDFAEYQTGSLAALPPPGESARAADTLVMLYTSGSSSRPKCVPLTHGDAIENAFNIGERQGLQPDDKVLISIPLFWSYGAVNALPAVISHGATLVLQKRFQPAEALDVIERQGCTGFYTLPAMTSALLAEPGFSLDTQKRFAPALPLVHRRMYGGRRKSWVSRIFAIFMAALKAMATAASPRMIGHWSNASSARDRHCQASPSAFETQKRARYWALVKLVKLNSPAT